jgi:ABC-type multidrug transport system fused ATPase/permease subunit
MSKNSTANPYWSMLKTAWKYAGKERRRYVLIYTMFMLSNLAQVLYPVIWGVFINDIQQNGWDVLRSAWLYAGAFVLVRLADWGFHGPARIFEQRLAFNLSRNFMQELYHKALHLPVKWHQDNHSGSTINRIRKAYEAMKKFFEHGFEYLHTFFKFLFSFAAMIYFAPLFGLVATVLGVLVVWIILVFDKPYIQTLDEVNEQEHRVSSTLFDSLSNIITVITLRLEQRMEAGLMKKVAGIFPSYNRNRVINEWKWFIVDMLVGIIYAIILVGYVWQHWQPGEVFLIGGLVMVMGYVERFTSVFHNVAYLYTDVVQYHTDVSAATNIIEAYEQHHTPDADRSLSPGWKVLDISGLSFSHREVVGSLQSAVFSSQAAVNGLNDGVEATPANPKPEIPNPTSQIGLNNLHLRIERGKRVALIGESGSGKSTLLALLRGLYEPEAGVRVLADGALQSGFDVIANHVTLFPQEPEIFENTIEYNITLGLPHESTDIDLICEMVSFSEVVKQLPKGLQSSIQEKGVNLSGGQKQRLALARGVFAAKDSDLILLDEPTCSVDPKTESKIYERLFEQFSNKAVVSALHRLHLLPRFDYIYVLENGSVADEGTFGELSVRSEIFRAMWAHQREAEERI